MMCGGISGFFSKLSWLITAVVALNVGLMMFNISILNYSAYTVFAANAMLKTYADYVVGAAGAYSLFGFVSHVYFCVSGTCTCCDKK